MSGVVVAGALAALGAFGVSACGGGPAPPASAPAATPGDVAAVDPLGPRPDVPEPAAYAPPVPVRYERDDGITVWLLERHGLPIVSMQLVVPAGSAHDPAGKAGLAFVTANMLDEGAGKRDAIALSSDLDGLGATLHTGAYSDYAFARLTVLKKNVGPAAEILGDVVARPQLSQAEWRRIHDLWQNQLRARQSDPSSVAGVVAMRRLFPGAHPYAHPAEGLTATAAKITLDDVKSFYRARWRPEGATFVVVGDMTRAELDPLLDRVLAGWKRPGGAPAEGKAASDPAAGPALDGRKVVVVDRPDAPQSVIAVARLGASAFDPASAPLTRVNAALGGSFTSRLNQVLREENGWSYGARSRFSFTRLRGAFVAQAAVQTEHTGDALRAMLANIEELSRSGLSDEEVHKTRQLARADRVEAYETVEATAARLGRSAGIGQSHDYDARVSALVDGADEAELARLSSTYLDLTSSVVVVVGPRDIIEPQLRAIGLGAVEASGPEGE